MNDRVMAIEKKLQDLEDRIKALEAKKSESVVTVTKSKKVGSA
jgi:hypothetical protein